MTIKGSIVSQVLITMCVVTICVSMANSQESHQPDIREYAWDLGEVEVGSEYEHVFDLNNPFDVPFSIHNVKKSCQSCTKIDYEKKSYLPGQSMRVTMTVNTKEVDPGRFESQAVLMDDPTGMRGVRLTLSGNLKSDGRLEAQPSTLKCGRITKPQSITRRLKIKRRDGTPLKFLAAKSSSPDIKVTKIEDAQEDVILAVEVNPVHIKPGLYAGKIIVETEGELHSHMEIDLEATVVGYASPKPRNLFLGRIPIGTHREWRITLPTTKPIAAIRASHNLGSGFAVAVNDVSGIIVRHDGQHSGVVNGEVRLSVEYTDGNVEQLVVPAIGVITTNASSLDITTNIGRVTIDIGSDLTDKTQPMSLAALASDSVHYYFNAPVASGKTIALDVPEKNALLSLRWTVKTSNGTLLRPSLLRILEPEAAAETIQLKAPAGTARCRLLSEGTATTAANPADDAELAHVYRVHLIHRSDNQTETIYTLQYSQKDNAPREDILNDLHPGEYETVAIARDVNSGSIMTHHDHIILKPNDMTTLTIPHTIRHVASVEGRILYNGSGRAVVFIRKANSKPITWSVITDIGVADAIGVNQPNRKGEYILMVPSPGAYVVTACIMNSGRDQYGVPMAQESKVCVAERGRVAVVEFDFASAASSQATTRSVSIERDNR